MTARVVIMDLETTGLLRDAGHEPWEYALIIRRRDHTPTAGFDTEHLWRTQPDLARADPAALQKNRYYQRTGGMPATWRHGEVRDLTDPGPPFAWSDPALVAQRIARILDGAVVVGANPGFDVDFLRPFLTRHGEAYTAHYRPMCVTTMGYAWLCALGKATGLSLPLSSDAVSRALGVDPDGFDRHTALGDCRVVSAQLDVITGDGT